MFWALTVFIVLDVLLSVVLPVVLSGHPTGWAVALGRRGWFSDSLSIALLLAGAVLGLVLWTLTAIAVARATRALKTAGRPASWHLILLSVLGGPAGAIMASGLVLLNNHKFGLRQQPENKN